MKKEIDKENKLIDKLKDIYFLMCEANLKELNIKLEDYNLKIKRFSENIVVSDKKLEKVHPKIEEVIENVKSEEVKGEEILSPLNGVFYRSPSPGAAPFVKEGDVVSAGSVLCIIEAMKVMNEIKAEKKCKILKVLCENGSSVSVGTKLFLVEII
ncbi:MAG: biotin/lipoyl-containing protein [Elusimicrobiota bacterium]|nr:acetyl-CoA carboxylase, biotin carboxyl carrier protein [Endomicrobiia bacterium]MCX7910512.1 acetyl-CoA carboxylase, biotin carboxyl carrier protein [Endomicrobiia bacterium]MDW8166066.1 biotin/lipoyl-containing protein [Elusimicrobiota bacterium]